MRPNRVQSRIFALLGLVVCVAIVAAPASGSARPRPAVTVRPAPDGCPVVPFVAELRALDLDVSVADRDVDRGPAAGVALQNAATGVQLVLWLEPSRPPERVPVGSASCEDATLMAALIVNRRLRAADDEGDLPPGLSLRAVAHATRVPLAGERPPQPPVTGPSTPPAPPWSARFDVLSGVEVAMGRRHPDAAGVEVRAVVSPPGGRLFASAGLGFDGLFAWPASRASVSGYAINAALRVGMRFRTGWLELEPGLGVGLAHHLVTRDDAGLGFAGRTLPKGEVALGLGVARPLSVRVDLGLLWAPWQVHVVAPSRELDATIGGVTARVRVGVGFDFL